MKNQLERNWWTVALCLFALNCYAADEAKQPVRFGVELPAPAAVIHKTWGPLADYLEEVLGRPVELGTNGSLEDLETRLDQLDFVFVNSYMFSLIEHKHHWYAISQMVNINNSTHSHGRFLVKKDSKIQSVADLKGRSMALINQYGAAAYLAPIVNLKRAGIDSEAVNIKYTNDLKKSVYMVLLGEVDSAAMCALNYRILQQKLDTSDLRVIGETDDFPESVIAAPENGDKALQDRVRQALLNAKNSSAGQAALKELRDMKIQEFVPYEPKAGEEILALRKEAGLM